MINKTLKMFGKGFVAVLLGALLVLAIFAISWICTCGVIALICMCFGWTFSWAIATGIWMIMCLARTVFSNNTTVKK